jgi:hypothetical protein
MGRGGRRSQGVRESQLVAMVTRSSRSRFGRVAFHSGFSPKLLSVAPREVRERRWLDAEELVRPELDA